MQELLYCMKISRHENFAVSRLGSKNREIKMPRKMILELDCEIKMSRKMVNRNREIKMHIKFAFPAYNVKKYKR